ncbi:MAG TPA: thiamine pyrophosphate-dependent enzyme, partial [Noviherbaspirillum sp.]|nr:thiamine pyrophosphate-dependent enzyme [Noviherbaspirillum sp.]
ELLAAARRPLVLLGGSGWNPEACADMRRFIEASALPAACAFRFQDLLDNRHPNYIGDVGIGINPKLAARIQNADLILAIGPRLGEMTTSGYTLLEAPCPHQKLVHIHSGAEELGRVYQGELMINSGMPQIASALAAMEPVDSSAWRSSVEEARAELVAWQAEPPLFKQTPARLNLWQMVQVLKQRLPADAILTNGAGNFATWAHRFWPYAGFRTQLAPTSGAMGYGVPAAVAAAIATRNARTVVNFAGDGDYMMNGQELATAVQYGAGVLFIVFNNGTYGTIRMHQERHFPARVSGTDLRNPDFAALARAYGAHGEMVDTTEAFGPALERALAHIQATGLPALIELQYEANLLTPNASLEQIRAAGQKASQES